MYKHLARIAKEERGDDSQASIAALLSENLNDVFSRSMRKRFVGSVVSNEEALAILHQYAGTEEPIPSDRIKP
jgi:hypothetical protein